MSKLSCRTCGYDLVEIAEAKKAVQAEYNYTDQEFESGQVAIKVWCPRCAAADGRVDDISEVDGDFYWDAYYA